MLSASDMCGSFDNDSGDPGLVSDGVDGPAIYAYRCNSLDSIAVREDA